VTIQEMHCPYCGDTTLWPEDNEAQMLVYGLKHREECGPPELRAEAIVDLESVRAEE
jgi:hypothetical protein